MVTGIAGSPQQAASNTVVVNMSSPGPQPDQKKNNDNRRVSVFVLFIFVEDFIFIFYGVYGQWRLIMLTGSLNKDINALHWFLIFQEILCTLETLCIILYCLPFVEYYFIYILVLLWLKIFYRSYRVKNFTFWTLQLVLPHNSLQNVFTNMPVHKFAYCTL